MREILFRGKRLDNGEWVYGYPEKRPSAIQGPDYGGPWYIWTPPVDPDDSGGYYNVDPATVGQYAGITDKNGKKIFEGDIIRFRLERKWYICFVQWSNAVCAFVAKINDDDPNDFFFLDGYMLEVLGNIYDDPELLEVKK